MNMKKSEAPKKSDLKKFKKILEDKREALVKAARESLQEDMTLDTNDLPDEMDLASSEYLQSFTFRLRGRERFFLDKIDQALKRIEDGSFGMCETCEEPISVKRDHALHPLQRRPRARRARLRLSHRDGPPDRGTRFGGGMAVRHGHGAARADVLRRLRGAGGCGRLARATWP